MAKVQMYRTETCPYCNSAKQLLDSKSIEYETIMVKSDEERMAMVERAEGRRTVPQIFINDQPIGGFDDLKALDDKGELDKLLNA